MATKVHRVRFYNTKPQAINCVSFNDKLKLIALARADASIEVWDLKSAPFLIRFIPGVNEGSVEAVGWVGSRLLSTGLGGSLIEWDLAKLVQKKTVLLTGYAAWCLDVNRTQTLVAVGTEQGYVNLYSVENNDIVYQKLFDKQDGRIMCCKFDKAGKILVTGSIDTIRVWDVETGHAVTRMSVTRRQKEVIVWSVAVLSDNTIVSGDSQGRLTFWDGSLGEQIESYTVHKADILSVAVGPGENVIYCSGVDPTITQFKKEQAKNKWWKNVQRHIHEHDVRGLVLNGKELISVGTDGYLTFSSYPPKWVMRIPPMLPLPRTSVCPNRKLMLLRHNNHLEVWKLGSFSTGAEGNLEFTQTKPQKKDSKKSDSSQLEQDSTEVVVNETDGNEKKCLKLTEHPVQLASIKTKHKKQIQCCEMSPSGEFVIYSTDSEVRMLKLEIEEGGEEQTSIFLSKVMVSGLEGACDRVAFAEDSRRMVLHAGGALHLLHVDPEAGAGLAQLLTSNTDQINSPLLHLHMSKRCPTGSVYIVAAYKNGDIVVYVEKKKFSCYVRLPHYPYVTTALTVDSTREVLVVVYSDQNIMEYDLKEKKVLERCGALPPQWLQRRAAALGVAPHPRRAALLLHDDTSVWVLERSLQIEEDEPEAKKKANKEPTVQFRVIPIKYLAGFHWLSEEEAVIVETLPESIVQQLPAPVRTNNWNMRP